MKNYRLRFEVPLAGLLLLAATMASGEEPPDRFRAYQVVETRAPDRSKSQEAIIDEWDGEMRRSGVKPNGLGASKPMIERLAKTIVEGTTFEHPVLVAKDWSEAWYGVPNYSDGLVYRSGTQQKDGLTWSFSPGGDRIGAGLPPMPFAQFMERSVLDANRKLTVGTKFRELLQSGVTEELVVTRMAKGTIEGAIYRIGETGSKRKAVSWSKTGSVITIVQLDGKGAPMITRRFTPIPVTPELIAATKLTMKPGKRVADERLGSGVTVSYLWSGKLPSLEALRRLHESGPPTQGIPLLPTALASLGVILIGGAGWVWRKRLAVPKAA